MGCSQSSQIKDVQNPQKSKNGQQEQRKEKEEARLKKEQQQHQEKKEEQKKERRKSTKPFSKIDENRQQGILPIDSKGMENHKNGILETGIWVGINQEEQQHQLENQKKNGQVNEKPSSPHQNQEKQNIVCSKRNLLHPHMEDYERILKEKEQADRLDVSSSKQINTRVNTASTRRNKRVPASRSTNLKDSKLSNISSKNAKVLRGENKGKCRKHTNPNAANNFDDISPFRKQLGMLYLL